MTTDLHASSLNQQPEGLVERMAREIWDLLTALSGHLQGYRPDIDAIHAALATGPDGAEAGK